MATLNERLAACYTGAVHDVLRMLGHDNFVLPPDIKAIAPGTRLAGPVWAVSRPRGHPNTPHVCMVGWGSLLAQAPAGHVVAGQPNHRESALISEFAAQ